MRYERCGDCNADLSVTPDHGDLIPGADMKSIPRVRRLRWAVTIKSPARNDAFDPNGL
jgi:hypothetical protein